MNRWSLGFFFALVAMPFIIVWTMTQGPRALDQILPVYTVSKIGKIESTATGVVLQDVALMKNHSCNPEGVIYASLVYKDGAIEAEILVPVEHSSGEPFVITNVKRAGEGFIVPELRYTASKDLLRAAGSFRLVITCQRPLVGLTRAYSNPILLR